MSSDSQLCSEGYACSPDSITCVRRASESPSATGSPQEEAPQGAQSGSLERGPFEKGGSRGDT